MNIRPAVKQDAVPAARLLYDALHDIAHQLTGEESEGDVLRVLEQFFREEEGRLSYRQAGVCEVEGRTAGVVVAYAGNEAKRLDKPIIERLRIMKSDPALTLDPEADEDEFYIDTLSVSPDFSGRGIGSALIRAAEVKAQQCGFQKIALAVLTSNTRAHALYLKSGYKADKEIIINKQVYYHMVKFL